MMLKIKFEGRLIKKRIASLLCLPKIKVLFHHVLPAGLWAQVILCIFVQVLSTGCLAFH